MSSDMTRFVDAIYHRKENYDFAKTEFSRRELKILLAIDGGKSVAEISALLSTDTSVLVPDFAKLVRLGLIQTEGGIISEGTSDLIYFDPPETKAKYTRSRLSFALMA